MTGNVRILQHWGAVVEPLLQWKSNKYYILWEWISGFRSSMQCACAVLYCHLWSARLYNIFPHNRINGTIFGKKVIECEKCGVFFSRNLSETFLILRRNERHINKNVYRSSCTYPLLLSGFDESWMFWTHFRKILKYHFFLNIWVAC
jgi:hypothetical protein